MDSIFVECLNSQIHKYKNAVMRDYWDYLRKPNKREGFAVLEITSDNYDLQRYFEVRIEDYIRRYLVNGFLGRILEARGNGIYPSSISEEANGAHYTNKEYEDKVTYEFVGDFVNVDKRIGVRYCELPDSFMISEDIDEVDIICWDRMVVGENAERTILANDKVIRKIGIYEFMKEQGFSDEEYDTYVTVLFGKVMDVKELLGIESISKLSPHKMFSFRFEVEQNIKELVRKIYGYIDTEKKLHTSNPELIQQFTWGYHIIDEENKKDFAEIEVETKQMLEAQALSMFESNEYYKALIGTSDVARSFMTSEYLYHQYDSNDQFDYTAIVSGYLKAVEQLLYRISFLAIDKGKKIKSRGGKSPIDDSDLPFKVDYTYENLKLGICDTTLGSLSYLVSESKKDIFINKKYKTSMVKCIRCFIRECRNDSFHKHNIDKWSRVEFIRKNAFIIIVLLLGLSNIEDSAFNKNKELGIIQNDNFERAYYWITSIKAESFYVAFGDEITKVKMAKTCEYPTFTRYGQIKDYTFLLDVDDQDNKNMKGNDILLIKRDRVPDSMWYYDANGEKIVYEIPKSKNGLKA